MAQNDDINTPAVAIIGLISAVVLIAIILGVQALYLGYERKVVERRPDANRAAENLIAEQEARLKRQGWLNRSEGTVAIPIDRAMELVVEESRRSQATEGERE